MKARLKQRKEIYSEHLVSPIDPVLVAITLALLVFGSIMVGSASMEIGLRNYGNPFHLVAIHHIYIFLGLLSFVFVLGLPMIFWERMGWVFLVISFFLLTAVLVPGIGKEVNGSIRWIQIGPINLQGSEFVKLFFLVYLARSLTDKTNESLGNLRTFLVPTFFLGLIVLLLMQQPDFGASIVLILSSAAVLYLSGVSSRFLLPFGLLILMFVMVFSFIQPYRFERIISFFDPWHDPFGSGYPALSEEMVIESNPDYIVVGHSDYLNKDLSIREGWGNISAVENSNVYFLDDTLASNWGTTTVQLVEELSTTFEESAQTNVYSDQLLLISLLFLVIMIYVLTRRNTKQKV